MEKKAPRARFLNVLVEGEGVGILYEISHGVSVSPLRVAGC